MAQPVAFALSALDIGTMGIGCVLRRAARLPQRFDLGRIALERTIGIEQAAMGAGIDQRPVVVLAVNLDQRGAQLLHHLNADRLVVDEGARPPIRKLDAAENEFVLGGDIVGLEQRARRMAALDLENGDHLPLFQALAYQGLVAAGAERQRESVEQDRLAGAGLASEHGEPAGKINVEPVDQDDIADRKSGKHGTGP